MNNIEDINNYRFDKSELYLFDTNVWLFIYDNNLSGHRNVIQASHYSNALRHIKTQQAEIMIDFTISSEYVHSYINKEYMFYKNQFISKKDFRASFEGKRATNNAISNLKMIYQITKKTDYKFTNLKMHDIMLELSKCYCEMNDLLIYDICKKNGFVLVTDDKDFLKNSKNEIKILTAM